MRLLKALSLLSVCVILSFCGSAQTNVAAVAGIRYLQPYTAIEYGSSFYCIRFHEAGPQKPNVAVRTAEFSLYKINKLTNQVTGVIHLSGDTTQADSVVFNLYQFMRVQKGRIHIVFNKGYINASPVQTNVHTKYIQLDTNLNLVIPEKDLSTYDYIQGFNIINDNKLLVSFGRPGPGYVFSMYRLFRITGILSGKTHFR